MNLPLVPFDVPETVTIRMPPGRWQDGIQGIPRIALTELDDATLAALIEEFALNVMAVARPDQA